MMGSVLFKTEGKLKTKTHMIHIIWSIILGAIVGYIAEFLVPGAQHLALWKIILIGIGGSFVGGLIGNLISRPKDGAIIHPSGLLLSIVGAVILLFAYTKFIH